MAKAGFIYCGSSKTCTCYQCNQSIFGELHKLQPSEEFMIKHHITWNTDCKHLRKYYGTDIIDPAPLYHETVDPCETTESRIAHNLHVIETAKTMLAVELANVGFIILVGSVTDMLIACFKCHYYHCFNPDSDNIKQLERDHLLCSGIDCPFLVEEKGISAIMNFNKNMEEKLIINHPL